MYCMSSEWNADPQVSVVLPFKKTSRRGSLTLPFSLVHSFIVDPTDEFIKNAFKEEELSEIIKKENGKDPLELMTRSSSI